MMATLFLIWNITRIVFVLLDVAVIGLIFYALPHALAFRPMLFGRRTMGKVTTLSRAVLREEWQRIRNKSKEDSADSAKLAIVEADRFVDHILKESGYQGEHMADRLEKLAPYGLTSFDRLWRAHRLRNELVHSAAYEIPRHVTQRTMQDYEAFLKEVKILE